MLFCKRKVNQHLNRIIEDLKDPRHWCKGYNFPKKCIIVSSFDVAVTDNSHLLALKTIRKEIQKVQRGSKKPDIATFNDHPLTTHQDVMRILHRAERATRSIWVV